MKKLISVMLVAVMVLSLSVVAFAEGGSVAKKPDVSVSGQGTTASGEKVDLVVDPVETPLTNAQKTEAEKQAVASAGTGATVGEPFEIHVEKNGVEDENAKGVTVTVVYTGDGVVAGVLYDNGNGGWDYAAATDKGNGKYEVTFAHFCTAMLVFKAPEKAPDTTTSKDTNKTTTSSTGVTSPKTGWD